jgi:hypothetical protein
MRKIVVSASVGSTADSRGFEDSFVDKLRAVGVEAVTGHSIQLDNAALPDPAFDAAVLNTGAQGLLLVRLLGVDTRTQVSTTMVHGGASWGRGQWGNQSRTTVMVPVQQVTQYELATVEAKLFDVQTRQLVWAATTTTFNPRSVTRETPAFADLVIGQLAARDIISKK